MGSRDANRPGADFLTKRDSIFFNGILLHHPGGIPAAVVYTADSRVRVACHFPSLQPFF
jgi:hypothetical protein